MCIGLLLSVRFPSRGFDQELRLLVLQQVSIAATWQMRDFAKLFRNDVVFDFCFANTDGRIVTPIEY